LVKKRKEHQDDQGLDGKKLKTDQLPVDVRIKQSTIPLGDEDYAKQVVIIKDVTG